MHPTGLRRFMLSSVDVVETPAMRGLLLALTVSHFVYEENKRRESWANMGNMLGSKAMFCCV